MGIEVKRVAFVTGASAGIGKETARRFLAEGYEVHAAARRLEEMRDLQEQGALLVHLDLTKVESIDAAVAGLLSSAGRIDVLVNNAGYGAYGAVEEVPMAAARDQMEVNLFGLAQLIRAVLPTMRAQRSGRIVNVTSIGGKLWSPLGAWYHASKFAVEGFSDALRNEVRPFGIHVVVVEPGGTKTAWTDIALAHMRKTSGAGPYAPFVDGWSRLAKSEAGLASPRAIADAIWRAASVRVPRARYVAPFAARIMLWLRWMLPDGAFDWLIAKAFRLPRTLAS